MSAHPCVGQQDMSLKSLTSKHSITVTPQTEVVGDAGGISFSDGTPRTVQGTIQPLSSAEMSYARQRGSEMTHAIYFSSDPNIATGDKLTFDGRTFDVEGGPTNTDELNRLWKVLVTEREQRDN